MESESINAKMFAGAIVAVDPGAERGDQP